MTRNLSILHADVALKVLNNLDTNSSIVYSPISLTIAMSMVYLGSNGDTKAEIKKFLIGDVDDEILHQRFNHFISHLNSNLKCANKIYVRDGLRLEEEFVRKLSIFYNGQIEQVNFSDLDTVDIINKYVEEATNNVIKDLISQRDIHEDTSTILINAIHFKGQWKKKFDNYDTSSSEFFITQDETKMVDMMYKRDKFRYYDDGEFQIIELNYEGDEQRMIILLPNERCSLINNMKSIDGEKLFNLMDSMELSYVHLYLPQFKIESNHQLKKALKKLGLEKPFTNDADFSLMSKQTKSSISEIIQKAFIEVGEEGTEAAAATAIMMVDGCVNVSKIQNEHVFRADHPFMYFILDRSDNILFNGIYL